MRVRSALAGFLLVVGAALGGCGSSGTTGTNDGDGACGEVVEDGGGTIPDPPDGALLCPPENTCNYQTQEGCAAGRACFPALNGMTMQIVSACEPAGTGVTGDICQEWTDCARGYGCPDGVCRKLCCGRDWSDSACDPGEACFRELIFTLPNGTDVASGAFVCFPSGCDVLSSDDCTSDRDCKIIDPRGTTACIRPSPGDLGDPCDEPAACGRGLSCIGDPGARTCRRLCRAEECGKPACRSGEGTCVHFNRDPAGVGECTPGWVAP